MSGHALLSILLAVVVVAVLAAALIEVRRGLRNISQGLNTLGDALETVESEHLRPLEPGADFVLHSATKYLGGHHDALLGAVVAKDADAAEALRKFRTQTGIVAAPDAAFLLSRGLKTLELRVRRQTETAQELVRRLEQHPRVETVRYPGFGGLLSFDVAGDPRKVETATRVIQNATSLGGVDSTIEGRFRWEGDRVPPGLLRLSVGLEDVEGTWADLEQALGR